MNKWCLLVPFKKKDYRKKAFRLSQSITFVTLSFTFRIMILNLTTRNLLPLSYFWWHWSDPHLTYLYPWFSCSSSASPQDGACSPRASSRPSSCRCWRTSMPSGTTARASPSPRTWPRRRSRAPTTRTATTRRWTRPWSDTPRCSRPSQ